MHDHEVSLSHNRSWFVLQCWWEALDEIDQRIQPGQLRPGQLRRAARHRPGLKRVFPALAVFRQPPVDRLAVQAQCRGNILGMRAGPDLLHCPDPQHLERLVIELAAVVVAHAPLSQITRSKSSYFRTSW